MPALCGSDGGNGSLMSPQFKVIKFAVYAGLGFILMHSIMSYSSAFIMTAAILALSRSSHD